MPTHIDTLTHLSLFSGIGGLDLAAEWAGFKTAGQCEWADYPTKILEKHWPDVPRWRDVRELTGESVRERTGLREITVVSGGFPCQPHSLAGQRLASDDERDLWGEYARIVCEIKPKWVVGENVSGLLSSENGRFFGRVLRDLAGMGYSIFWYCFPAWAVGAPYERNRVAIVAGPDRNRLQGSIQRPHKTDETCNIQNPPSENIRTAIGLWNGKGGNSDRIRESDGIPNWMDRIKSLGNCVNPYQFYPIFKAIAEVEANK